MALNFCTSTDCDTRERTLVDIVYSMSYGVTYYDCRQLAPLSYQIEENVGIATSRPAV